MKCDNWSFTVDLGSWAYVVGPGIVESIWKYNCGHRQLYAYIWNCSRVHDFKCGGSDVYLHDLFCSRFALFPERAAVSQADTVYMVMMSTENEAGSTPEVGCGVATCKRRKPRWLYGWRLARFALGLACRCRETVWELVKLVNGSTAVYLLWHHQWRRGISYRLKARAARLWFSSSQKSSNPIYPMTTIFMTNQIIFARFVAWFLKIFFTAFDI